MLQVDSTGSSGYSSETDAEEEANIIYYEVFLIHRAYFRFRAVSLIDRRVFSTGSPAQGSAGKAGRNNLNE
jgi:hypothetical protein